MVARIRAGEKRLAREQKRATAVAERRRSMGSLLSSASAWSDSRESMARSSLAW
jgi:hypothetical protein